MAMGKREADDDAPRGGRWLANRRWGGLCGGSVRDFSRQQQQSSAQFICCAARDIAALRFCFYIALGLTSINAGPFGAELIKSIG
jgi:hypothetical protein